MTPKTHRPVVVTQGDPDGVGLELILRLGAQGCFGAQDVIIADPQRMQALAARLPQDWARAGWDAVSGCVEGEPGLTQTEALRRGVDRVLAAEGSALVTAPIDKAVAHAEGFAHPGHTEYLAARCGVTDFAMLMAGSRLRVALATIHVALQDVVRVLGQVEIVRAGSLLARGLREHFGVPRPRIGVLSLNPHAGEQGLLGDQEARIIAPAIETLRAAEPDCTFEGPLPADTAFFAHISGRYDALLAMYHDQGLGPFKLIHFSDGVNVTLGLPFVRTSPDHGTAKDIAGRGIADPSSMRAALQLARGQWR